MLSFYTTYEFLSNFLCNWHELYYSPTFFRLPLSTDPIISFENSDAFVRAASTVFHHICIQSSPQREISGNFFMPILHPMTFFFFSLRSMWLFFSTFVSYFTYKIILKIQIFTCILRKIYIKMLRQFLHKICKFWLEIEFLHTVWPLFLGAHTEKNPQSPHRMTPFFQQNLKPNAPYFRSPLGTCTSLSYSSAPPGWGPHFKIALWCLIVIRGLSRLAAHHSKNIVLWMNPSWPKPETSCKADFFWVLHFRFNYTVHLFWIILNIS